MKHESDLDRPSPRSTKRPPQDAEAEFKVDDRRYWAQEPDGNAEGETAGEKQESTPREPSLIAEFRERAEAAEAKLQEYIGAFKEREREQDQFRVRLQRDVDRKVELKFSGMISELLETMDALDLSASHLEGLPPQAESLGQGLIMVRQRFLTVLERHGVERLAPDDAPFDPNEAEALRVDPVDDRQRDGVVTETIRPGYRLGELVIRPAQVAVGRYTAASS